MSNENLLNIEFSREPNSLDIDASGIAMHNKFCNLSTLLMALNLLAFVAKRKITYICPEYGSEAAINIFTMIVADSGVGKTRLYKKIFGPHLAFYYKSNEAYDKQCTEHKRELKIFEIDSKRIQKLLGKADIDEDEHVNLREKFKSLEAAKPEAPLAPPILVSNITLSALKRTLAKQGCVIATSEGAAQLDRICDDMMTLMCDSWDGDYFETRDRYQDLPVSLPALSFMLALQPDPFFRYMKNMGYKAVQRGFLSRVFLMFMSRQHEESNFQKKFFIVNPLQEKVEVDLSVVEERFHQRIGDIMKQPDSRMLKFSPEAKEAIQSYTQQMVMQEELYRGQSIDVHFFISKAPVHLQKIAALLHIYNESGDFIEAKTIHHAAEILNRIFLVQLNFYNPARSPELEYEAMQVLYWLKRRTGYPYFTKRQIQSECSIVSSAQTLNHQLEYLERCEYITITPVGKSERVELTPKGRNLNSK